ncbi:MAG: protein kinase [Cyanobacteria bacterium J06634_6]
MPSALLSNRYKVLSVLGDGGFGKTFLVEDTQMPSNRRCVLKQLKPVHGESGETTELRQLVQDRFQREAATLELLGEAHPQIPCLYAYFLEAEQFYLVQEWIEGQTVAEKVRQEGPQREHTVQAMMVDLLGAIAFIHSKAIVHRDIKPDNIILRAQSDKPVLIDFGAVKETMNTVMSSQADSTRSIVVGTPGYMPAEQLAGRPVYASDIYSLGMTAIYMLTGKYPQEMASDPASGRLLWREHAPHITPGFADLLDISIHTNSHSRFPTAQAMQSALGALAQTETVVSPMVAAPINAPVPHDSAPYNPALQSTAIAPHHTINQSQPTLTDGRPTASTKSPFIIGGIVGLSVLIGSVIVVNNLPETADLTTGSSITESVPDAITENTAELLPPDDVPLPESSPDAPLPPEITEPETIESALATEPQNSAPVWEFMGNAATGEALSVNVSSIRPSGSGIDFEYSIGNEIILASADCITNRWYADAYGWYSPQSNATQSMMNFVCQ